MEEFDIFESVPVGDCEFNVEVKLGDVFINGKFVAQLCFDSSSVASAIANYLVNGYPEE